jgi:signal transduction histidine kinase
MLDFKILFESVPGLYLVLTPDLRIIAVSDAYLQATKTKRDEILNKGLFEVFPDNPDDPNANGVANLSASLKKVLLHKKADTMAIQKYDIPNPQSEGGGFEVRYWSPVNSPVLDEHTGEVKYIIHRAEDVTEFVAMKEKAAQTDELKSRLVKMEAEVFARAQEIQSINTELSQSYSELEAFTYSVSHDLRAPLRIISGFIDILRTDHEATMNEDAKRLTEVIRKNAKEMGLLIDDLLNFSRIGKIVPHPKKIDMLPVVQEVVDGIRIAEQNEAAQIQILDLPKAYCDYSLTKQVWVNLISNAVKYSRNRVKPLITIGATTLNDTVTYYVKDNGVGFDMKYAGKLFGIFQRLHRNKDFEGTGVGLALVHRIITKHGGKIWAEAKPEEGATFYFTLSAQ